MQFIDAALHFERHLDILFAMVFCETALLVFFFLPGDPLLFVSGALCVAPFAGPGLPADAAHAPAKI